MTDTPSSQPERAGTENVPSNNIGAHKVMTESEYLALNLKGWHQVYWNWDGMGGVAIRYMSGGYCEHLGVRLDTKSEGCPVCGATAYQGCAH